MLRALLFVHGVLALGTGFVAADLAVWWPLFAAGSALALPALLLWLSTGCLAQRFLGRVALPLQAALGAVWGAVCALLPWWGWQAVQVAPAPALRSIAIALLGAVMASLLLQWLGQRARLRVPASTTARLAELQSRIRPHFLFNTLNTAIALVRIDPARAEGVLEDLSELFRVALADGGAAASATLDDEVELARRYLAIEQLRFGARLDVRWELDAAAAQARVPPLLLQPLLENAVRHGVEPSAAGGQIRVRTRVRHGQVEIAVVNTVPAEASTPGHGMALRNVRERLRLMHDVAADFSARRDGPLYRVDIVVPL
jgi:two-component system sensor histidine kinase AlgZ